MIAFTLRRKEKKTVTFHSKEVTQISIIPMDTEAMDKKSIQKDQWFQPRFAAISGTPHKDSSSADFELTPHVWQPLRHKIEEKLSRSKVRWGLGGAIWEMYENRHALPSEMPYIYFWQKK